MDLRDAIAMGYKPSELDIMQDYTCKIREEDSATIARRAYDIERILDGYPNHLYLIRYHSQALRREIKQESTSIRLVDYDSINPAISIQFDNLQRTTLKILITDVIEVKPIASLFVGRP